MLQPMQHLNQLLLNHGSFLVVDRIQTWDNWSRISARYHVQDINEVCRF